MMEKCITLYQLRDYLVTQASHIVNSQNRKTKNYCNLLGLSHPKRNKEGFIFSFEFMVFYWLLDGLNDHFESLNYKKGEGENFQSV